MTALAALQEYYQAEEALQETPKDEELNNCESDDDDIVFITLFQMMKWTIID